MRSVWDLLPSVFSEVGKVDNWVILKGSKNMITLFNLTKTNPTIGIHRIMYEKTVPAFHSKGEKASYFIISGKLNFQTFYDKKESSRGILTMGSCISVENPLVGISIDTINNLESTFVVFSTFGEGITEDLLKFSENHFVKGDDTKKSAILAECKNSLVYNHF